MKFVIIGTTLVVLILAWFPSIDETPITHDAVESLQMGVNLAHHGVISGSEESASIPTMYREPLPAVVNALSVHILDLTTTQSEIESYFSGFRAQYLKYQNFVWIVIGTLSAFGLVKILSGSFWLSWLTAVAINMNIPFLNRININTLYTETAAKALLLLSLFLLVYGVQSSSRKILFLSGISFALLTLTKALFLYVFVALIIILPIVHFVFSSFFSRNLRVKELRVSITHSSVLALGFFIVVTPWLVRNYIQCDKFAISERSGIILMQRAVLNEVNPTEYAGLFYRYAHPKLQPAVGRLLRFKQSDFQEGGKLQRISRGIETSFYEADLKAERDGEPEKAITYYRKARAIRQQIWDQYKLAGIERPLSKTDDELKRLAFERIIENPIQHIAFTLPALWRGAFIGAPLLVLGLVFAFATKREGVALVVLPTLGMVVLCAISTPFDYRFGTTIMPVLVVVLFVMLHAMLKVPSLKKLRLWQFRHGELNRGPV